MNRLLIDEHFDQMKIAVVGAGLIGRRHIECILKSTSCNLAAVVDTSPDARVVAEKTGAPFYFRLDEYLARTLPDGVIIATPNAFHVEQGISCLQEGIPVLIEKPVAGTVAEGMRLAEIEKNSTASVLVGHHRAHSAIMRKAREIVDEGTLGEIVAVSGHALFYKPDDYFDAAPWRTQPGGGPMLINLIHEIHNLRMLCGEIAFVQAFSSNRNRNFQVEDTAAIILHFESGVLGTFLLSDTAASSKSWEQTSLENPCYAADPQGDCYHVAGTCGSLDIPTMRLRTYPDERSWWKPFDTTHALLERRNPLHSQLEHFCRVIRGEVDPLVSLHDGLQNLSVLEALTEAAFSGRTVAVSNLSRQYNPGSSCFLPLSERDKIG